MNAGAIQDDIPEDEIGPRLAEFTRIALAGEQAARQRVGLMRLARYTYGWTQQRIADACQIKQASVSKALSKSSKMPSQSPPN